MATRWFRIAFARNAFLRSLAEQGLGLESLSIMHGIRAMTGFFSDYRPQHGERDELVASWGPTSEAFEFRLERRMQRHDQPPVTLSLVFVFPLRADRASTGESPVLTWREAAATEGYQLIRGSRPTLRRVDQD